MTDYCMEILELLQWNWKDIIEVLFWLGTLLIVWIWLQTWKRQLKWTIEYELAKKILHRVYQAERYFNQVRSPVISAYIDPSDTPEKKHEKYHQIYKTRIDPLFSVIEELNVDILEAEVLWGNSLKELVYEMFRHLRELQVWVEEYIKIKSGLPGYTDDYPLDLKKEYREIIYWKQLWYFTDYHKDDRFALEFERKIKNTENYLKPFLRK